MASHDIEVLAHRWHLEIVQGGNVDLIPQVLSPDVVIHANGTELRGHEGARQLVTALQAALPDLQITHDEAIVSGSSVAIRWTADATQGRLLWASAQRPAGSFRGRGLPPRCQRETL